MPFNAPQPTRPSQTPAHTTVSAHAREGHAHVAGTLRHTANAHIRAHAYAPALSALHAHAYTATPAYAYARAQKPRRMAAIPVIAVEGIHVPAYAGCISRLLAPKVARPPRRQGRRFSSTRRQAVAFRNSVSQPMPPQGTSAPAKDPRRHGLSNSVAPAARKRSASAAAGACCAVTLRTAPCPLRSLTLPARSLRGLRKPRSGSCSAGDEKNEKNEPSMHVSQRFCTFVREYVDNLPARPRVSLSSVSKRFMRRRTSGKALVENTPCGRRAFPFSCRRFRAAPIGARAHLFSRPSAVQAAEKDAREPSPAARRPSSRSAPRRCCGRCRPGCRRATSRRGRGRTP